MLRFCGYNSSSYIEDSLAAGILILQDSPLLPCSLGHRYMGYIIDGARCHMICPLYFDPLWISMMNSIYFKKNFFFMKNLSYLYSLMCIWEVIWKTIGNYINLGI